MANPTENPQLIKTANLTVQVKDIETALDQVSQILNSMEGDLLNLEDLKPQGTGDRHRSSMQVRVPQESLNDTLEKIEEIGTVQNRSIQAQDVSNQLIDNQARLKNLRKSEEMVLKIMERSGSIPDVLAASTELTTIREISRGSMHNCKIYKVK
ncbi:MAG: DUF4349 domain-containing protein [Acaryochloridaceae cyanobacterium RL_2_7]|nr:DUF4349 domain-containing protein [Acaryochloridaceae cyanobacterium RL_2_7]